MKRKLIPAMFILLGLIGSFLPFTSVRIEGSDAVLVAAAETAAKEEAPPKANAWSYKDGRAQVGMLVAVPLVIVGVFAALIAATRLGRGLSIPMLVLGILGSGLCALVIAKLHDKGDMGGVQISTGAGIGLYLIAIGMLGATATALLGTISPDPRRVRGLGA